MPYRLETIGQVHPPATFVHQLVVEAAHQHQVVELGSPAPDPMDDVVGGDEPRGPAPGKAAPVIPSPPPPQQPSRQGGGTPPDPPRPSRGTRGPRLRGAAPGDPGGALGMDPGSRLELTAAVIRAQ